MRITPETVDALLPQTQCGLCGFGGCMPYAEALVFDKAAINLCPPGGVKTLQALGNLLDQSAEPYLEEMLEKTKPPMIAVIREAECIGCTKCIQACPVDAIIGGAKQMHAIITADCTGCELCVPPCPVDCIDMLIQPNVSDDIALAKSNDSRQRFQLREKRLLKVADTQKVKPTISSTSKMNYIQAALDRSKKKKETQTL